MIIKQAKIFIAGMKKGRAVFCLRKNEKFPKNIDPTDWHPVGLVTERECAMSNYYHLGCRELQKQSLEMFIGGIEFFQKMYNPKVWGEYMLSSAFCIEYNDNDDCDINFIEDKMIVEEILVYLKYLCVVISGARTFKPDYDFRDDKISHHFPTFLHNFWIYFKK
jgi:hypothetical protein